MKELFSLFSYGSLLYPDMETTQQKCDCPTFLFPYHTLRCQFIIEDVKYYDGFMLDDFYSDYLYPEDKHEDLGNCCADCGQLFCTISCPSEEGRDPSTLSTKMHTKQSNRSSVMLLKQKDRQKNQIKNKKKNYKGASKKKNGEMRAMLMD